MRQMFSKQRGYLALLAILMILVIGFLGTTISYIFTDTANANLNAFLANKAYYIAQAGAEQAHRYLLDKNVACANITSNSDLTSASFGGGVFSVTGIASNASTTASGSILSTDTSIAVATSAGLASQGIILIDSEI